MMSPAESNRSTRPPKWPLRRRSEQTAFMGVEFDAFTTDDTVAEVMRMVETGRRGWISTVNVAILMMMRSEPVLADYIEGSAIVLADGQPIVWASKRLGRRLPERVTGVDLVLDLCDACDRTGRSVFLLGASQEVLDGVVARIRSTNPGLRLGAANGYFTDEQSSERVDQVREFGADVLIVAMGVPRQEAFVAENWESLGATVAIGVGGSFDVIAGRLKRAPGWMQVAGLEWAFRLSQEPRRLARRYAETNTRFALLLAREAARNYLVPASDGPTNIHVAGHRAAPQGPPVPAEQPVETESPPPIGQTAQAPGTDA